MSCFCSRVFFSPLFFFIYKNISYIFFPPTRLLGMSIKHWFDSSVVFSLYSHENVVVSHTVHACIFYTSNSRNTYICVGRPLFSDFSIHHHLPQSFFLTSSIFLYLNLVFPFELASSYDGFILHRKNVAS